MEDEVLNRCDGLPLGALDVSQVLTLVWETTSSRPARTRTLTEAAVHFLTHAATARDCLTGLGLQRARVRALRAERLLPAGKTVRQFTLDNRDDKLRRLDSAPDKAEPATDPAVPEPCQRCPAAKAAGPSVQWVLSDCGAITASSGA